MAQLATFGYVLAALLMLGVLITVHELGHFLVARACGMAVCEFAIGMGPKIFSRKSKKTDTLYSLRAFPLGGFCLFYGEDEEVNDARAYNRQPVWKRFLSVLAGPAMNFVVAILLFVLVLSGLGLRTYYNEPIVGTLMPDMPAREAGLQKGDLVLAVNGVPVADREAASAQIGLTQGEPVELTIGRGEQRLVVTVTPKFSEADQRYLVGIKYAYWRDRQPLGTSIQIGFEQSVAAVQAIYGALRDMIFKGEGVEGLSGPVGTVNIIQQETREEGIDTYLLLAAMISINLGFMNLLPIPGLDGSRLVFFIVEAIRRKPIDRNIEGGIHFAGFVLLVGLMIVFTYKDIVKLITG